MKRATCGRCGGTSNATGNVLLCTRCGAKGRLLAPGARPSPPGPARPSRRIRHLHLLAAGPWGLLVVLGLWGYVEDEWPMAAAIAAALGLFGLPALLHLWAAKRLRSAVRGDGVTMVAAGYSVAMAGSISFAALAAASFFSTLTGGEMAIVAALVLLLAGPSVLILFAAYAVRRRNVAAGT